MTETFAETEPKFKNILLLPRDLMYLDYGPRAAFMKNIRYMAQETKSSVVDPSKYNQVQLEEVENKFFEGAKVYTMDLPQMKFPQDRILTTPNIVFYNPDYFRDLSKIKGEGEILENLFLIEF